MKKELLKKLDKWHKEVDELYKRKAKLEQEILMIDLDLYKQDNEYDKLCRELMKIKGNI